MGSRRVDWDSFRPSNGSCINRALLEPSCTKGQYVWFSLLEFARGNFFSAAGFHQKKRENRKRNREGPIVNFVHLGLRFKRQC